MDISIEEMNSSTVQTAYSIIKDKTDLDETIAMIRQMYDNIRNDFFLLAKRRLEMILFRLHVIKYYSVEKRIGAVDRCLYCQDTEEAASYRTDVIRRFDQTFDRQKSMQILKKATELYSEKQDSEQAFPYFLEAAQEGSAICAYQCGKMRMAGDGCEKDEFEAAFWHWQSVNMNNANAIPSLGYDYYDGRGVWKGMVRAMYWFATGACQLEETCVKELADMMLYGEVLSDEEETGEKLKAALGHLEEPEAAGFVRAVGSAVNRITAEWLQENEGGV